MRIAFRMTLSYQLLRHHEGRLNSLNFSFAEFTYQCTQHGKSNPNLERSLEAKSVSEEEWVNKDYPRVLVIICDNNSDFAAITPNVNQ